MSFIDAIKSGFKNYANFSGRARRSEFWYWALFTGIVSGVLSGIGSGISSVLMSTMPSSFENSVILSYALNAPETIWSIATLIPSLAMCVRRLHDLDKSGLYVLLELIPIVGWIILLVWYTKDSQQGMNKYGNSPKYPVMVDQYGNPIYQQPVYQPPVDPNNYYAPQQPQAPVEQNYYAPQPPVEQPNTAEYYQPNDNQ